MEPKKAERVQGTIPLSRVGLSALAAHEKISNETRVQAAVVTGTPILTMDGELPVEFLSPGDLLISRNAGTAALLSIEIASTRTTLICIRAGSLGQNRPESDTRLVPDQPVLVRDWRAQALHGRSVSMMAAADLVDDGYIHAAAPVDVKLVTITLGAPHVIYAGGIEIGVEPGPAPLPPTPLIS